ERRRDAGMLLRISQKTLLTVLVVIGVAGAPGFAIVATALQGGEIFSRASGHAQGIAQGVAELPADAAWRVVFHSIEPGSAAELPADGPGFMLVDTGGVIAGEEGQEALLAP